MSDKTYEPYFIIVWASEIEKMIDGVKVSEKVEIKQGGKEAVCVVKEISYKEDAYDEYQDWVQKGVQKIALAKLVKKYVEG